MQEMDFIEMEFIKTLNNELRRQDISHQKLGEMCGLTGRVIGYYVKGQRTSTIYAADRILKALGVTMVLGEKQEEADE